MRLLVGTSLACLLLINTFIEFSSQSDKEVEDMLAKLKHCCESKEQFKEAERIAQLTAQELIETDKRVAESKNLSDPDLIRLGSTINLATRVAKTLVKRIEEQRENVPRRGKAMKFKMPSKPLKISTRKQPKDDPSAGSSGGASSSNV